MKNKVMFWISLILQAVQVAAVTVALIFAWRLDMIPAKYMALVLAAFAVVVLATALLMFLRGKKPVGVARRVIAWLIVLVTVAGCGVMAKVLGDLHSTFDTITTTIVSQETRDVYVRKDDPALTIADAADYTFAIVSGYDDENTALALSAIARETGKEVQTKSFQTVFEMVDALYDGTVDALILNSGYITILEEYPDYEDFPERARLLYAAVLKIPASVTTQEPTKELQLVPSVTNTPFVVYISGSDTRSSLLTKSRSDVNILAVVNPNTHQVLLVNTPRDYYVPNPAGGGALDKLTHCGIYGIECSMGSLGMLYNTKIDYYAQINFTGFETLIDAVGGITVVADESFEAGHFHYFEKGEHHLDGAAALAFARERYHVSGGDRGRGKNQMKVISAVIDKLTSGTAIISRYSEILASLEGMFTTSLPKEDLSKLVKMQLNEMPQWEVYSFAVSGGGGSEKTYSMPGLYASVMYQDQELVSQASSLVNQVLNGEVITSDSVKPVK